MHWDIVNTSLNIPKCVFCTDTTDQMVRFHTTAEYTWICSDCAPHVKDALDKWPGLKSRYDIPDHFTENKSPYLDPLL